MVFERSGTGFDRESMDGGYIKVRDPLERARASECVEKRIQVVFRYEAGGEPEFLPETLACLDEFTHRGGMLGVLCDIHEGPGSEKRVGRSSGFGRRWNQAP